MRRPRVGPGVLVAAAFIGPGTVTAATLAGAEHGYVLGWGIAFSTVATAVLQEAAARLGIVGGVGLGEAIRRRVPAGLPFGLAAGLVVAAVFLGNAAYEGGNLRGAALGLDLLAGTREARSPSLGVGAVAAVAAALLGWGRLSVLSSVLAGVVAVLALAYLAAAVAVGVDWGAALAGLLPLRLPSGAELTVVALVGTTVVPYNLFLHASAAREHYGGRGDLAAARRDTYVSVAVGGAVTWAISLVSARAFAGASGTPAGAADLAAPLGNALGGAGTLVVGVGLLAAGLSSALTAPLAAAYATAGLFGWDARDLRAWRPRAVWGAVLVTGVAVASTGARPVALIFLAQVANGLLLPVVAGFLLWAANDRALLGSSVNPPGRNFAAGVVVLVAAVLGARGLYGALP